MNKFELASPWITYYRKLDALFNNDPEVTVKYDVGANTIKLYVNNNKKADALTKILESEKTFGNVTVHVKIIPSNDVKQDNVTLFQDAFEGNSAFKSVVTRSDTFVSDFNYVLFKKEVVQFFNDDLSDLNRVESTLYEDIARDVFKSIFGIYFCTDIE